MKKALGQLLALGSIALAASGCGRQAFIATSSVDHLKAPGTFNVPPKVDILLVQDDTGSMGEIFSNISAQTKTFLAALGNRGWDYHFATVPLTTLRPIDQVQASRYDGNWGGSWLQPYPGAKLEDTIGVAPYAFRFPDEYSGFLRTNEILNAKNGVEPGFEFLKQNLQQRSLVDSGFLRSDALLAVLIVGNGEDTSKVNMCYRYDGAYVPCELGDYAVTPTGYRYSNVRIACGTQGANPAPYCASGAQSLNEYKTFFSHVKPDAQQLKFYSAVAFAKRSDGSCMGSYSRAGVRYQQMASSLGGRSFDICTTPVSAVLDAMASHLQTVTISFRTHYLFIANEPTLNDPSKPIRICRHPGGDSSQCALIPPLEQDGVNGWSYAGYLKDAYAIDYPIELNQATGYAIELHGSAKLMGNDTATIEYFPKGAQDAISE